MEQNNTVQSEFIIGTTTYQVTSRYYEQGKEKEDFATKLRRLILSHREESKKDR